MKVIFFTDLDNTLIYSKRHDIGENKMCVEEYNDRPLSFMTNYTYDRLVELNQNPNILVVPVTTRTKEQYERIQLGKFKYALVDNGGILLENGEVNYQWYDESLSYAKHCSEHISLAQRLLQEDTLRSMEVRFIDNLFVFTKTSSYYDIVQLYRNLSYSNLTVDSQGNKVYVFPKQLSKGNAIKRFKAYLGNDYDISCVKTIAAGDSTIDFPMAMEVGKFITSNIYCPRWAGVAIYEGKRVFSDVIVDYVKAYEEERI